VKNYIIREVNDHELERCADVIRRGFGTVAEEFGLTVENCPTNGAFIKTERLVIDKSKGKRMYVLIADDEIIGYMQIEEVVNNNYEVQKITVLPEFRHCGYGKIMLDYAKEKIKELKGTKITLGIIEENELLKRWYLKNGFVHVGTHKFNHLPFTTGFMECPLECYATI
jgi:ribosomal protein S18 acetylase RimI-like enzyme